MFPSCLKEGQENHISAVVTAIEDWGSSERIIRMCFDTAVSNTERRSGPCLHIEQKLFHFASCYHILELVLSAVFQAQMSLTMSIRDVPIFKRFKSQWKDSLCQHLSLDLIHQVTSFGYFPADHSPPSRRLQGIPGARPHFPGRSSLARCLIYGTWSIPSCLLAFQGPLWH